jgi:type IX secretion system PorP/SprF family membrane protein
MKKLGIILFLFMGLNVVAQQDPLLSHNIFNQMAINPAYTGSSGMICATAIHRQQWMGFGKGSPVTSLVNIDAAISPFGLSSGIGVNILQDQFGFNQDIGVDLSYAVRFAIQGVGNLAIGLKGGFINNTLDPTWNFPDSPGDVIVPSGKENSVNLDLGAGVYFNNSEMFFGISAAHLNESKFYDGYDSHYKRQFYLIGGYFLQVPGSSWEINPTALISSNLTINHLTIGSNFIYNKRFWGGVSYRVAEVVTGMVGFELFSGLRIGYAYDFSITEISSFNSGSHEFMLGYSFSLKKERAPQQYKSIRFL